MTRPTVTPIAHAGSSPHAPRVQYAPIPIPWPKGEPRWYRCPKLVTD